MARRPPAAHRIVTMTDAKGRGIWGGMLCRKRYVGEQVVGLGAGLSATACRVENRVRVYEVDLPDNVGTKRARVRAALRRARRTPAGGLGDRNGSPRPRNTCD